MQVSTHSTGFGVQGRLAPVGGSEGALLGPNKTFLWLFAVPQLSALLGGRGARSETLVAQGTALKKNWSKEKNTE